MNYFNYNGKLYEQGVAVIAPDNRGLRYGDGLFETIKYTQNNFILLDEHLNRLWLGMEAMTFTPPKLFTREYIADQLHKLVTKNKHSSARVRLTVIRADGGLFDPQHLQPQLLIQSFPLTQVEHINQNGLKLCMYRDAIKSCDRFSHLKHNNFLPYLMGALFAKTNKCNDAIILNNYGRIADSCIANIFIFKDNVLMTPAIEEGCVAGVMRNYILAQAQKLGYSVNETALTESMLMEADEVFCSNSIFNIKWVAAIEGITFTNELTARLYQQLSKTNDGVFC